MVPETEMKPSAPDAVYVGFETGGTKILGRLVDAQGNAIANGRWPTSTPDVAAAELAGFVRDHLPAGARLAGAAMAAFGPIIVDPDAHDYGRLLDTPKPGWSGANLRLALSDALGVPVALDTDVNLAARAEAEVGAGKGVVGVAYVTVGTGIGAGLAVGARTLHGAMHPEIGHLRLVRMATDHQPSHCPFHSDCAEGLVAGPAIGARLGRGAEALGEEPDAFALVAGYLGQLAAAIVLAWSPRRIVWGGGVMKTAGLIPELHKAMLDSLGGYGVGDRAGAADFCVPAALTDAGLEGALLVARGVG